jgi:hypothetical protein
MTQNEKRFPQGTIQVNQIVLIDHPAFGQPDQVGRDVGKVGQVVQFYDEPGHEDLALVQVEGKSVQIHVPSQLVKPIANVIQ